MKLTKYQVEVTDTFSGEANYSWVHRYTIECKPGVSPVRKAKKAAGWENVRCSTMNDGDFISLVPAGMCQIMFINYVEEVTK